MEKPNSKKIDQIISIIEEKRRREKTIKEMEVSINELKKQANSLVLEISKEHERIEIATYLYWLSPEINANELSQAILGCKNIHRFLRSISSATTNIGCDRCGVSIEVTSRAQLSEQIKRAKGNHIYWPEGYKAICKTCEDEIMSVRREQWQEYERIRNARFLELKKMKYQDYLQTPEWKERRQKHLKSAGFRCQICNSSEQPLDVHHRTYERRGNEYYKDLIVLCRNCHSTFHESGKVV